MEKGKSDFDVYHESDFKKVITLYGGGNIEFKKYFSNINDSVHNTLMF